MTGRPGIGHSARIPAERAHAGQLNRWAMHLFLARAAAMNRSSAPVPCLWCSRAFVSRRRGSQQKFCSSAHRVAFHAAARRWAEHAVAARLLTVADLRNQRQESVHARTESLKAIAGTDLAPEPSAPPPATVQLVGARS